MNATIAKSAYNGRDALSDGIALIILVVLVASASHLTALPFYQLNPMAMGLCLLFSYRQRKRHGATAAGASLTSNGIVVALLLPFVVSILTGMPRADKAVCMAMEFGVWGVATEFLTRGGKTVASRWLLMLASMAVGKMAYYMAKWAVMGSATADTDITIQLCCMVAYSLLYALLTSDRTVIRGRKCGHGRH